MEGVTLTKDQGQACQAMLRHGHRIGGYAGTGKSVTIGAACEMARATSTKLILATPTNKAAHVLRQIVRGAAPVMTLHSLTTTPGEVPEYDEESGKIIGTKMVFTAKASPIKEHVVIDEGSMLGGHFFKRIEHLFESYAIVGDPFQLPPVKDTQLLSEDSCDVMLTEVMRQAQDNPALAYATELRQGGRRRAQEFGISVTDGIYAKDLGPMGEPDAICITFTNSDRHWFNQQIRLARTGSKHWCPREGDKLIARYTDHESGVYNGMTGNVAEVFGAEDDRVTVRVSWAGDPPLDKLHVIDARRLRGREVAFDDRFGDHIEYGYAVTCHAAQGSSWGSVYVVPNIRVLLKHQGREGMRRWMYTAITRVAGTGEVRILDNS